MAVQSSLELGTQCRQYGAFKWWIERTITGQIFTLQTNNSTVNSALGNSSFIYLYAYYYRWLTMTQLIAHH